MGTGKKEKKTPEVTMVAENTQESENGSERSDLKSKGRGFTTVSKWKGEKVKEEGVKRGWNKKKGAGKDSLEEESKKDKKRTSPIPQHQYNLSNLILSSNFTSKTTENSIAEIPHEEVSQSPPSKQVRFPLFQKPTSSPLKQTAQTTFSNIHNSNTNPNPKTSTSPPHLSPSTNQIPRQSNLYSSPPTQTNFTKDFDIVESDGEEHKVKRVDKYNVIHSNLSDIKKLRIDTNIDLALRTLKTRPNEHPSNFNHTIQNKSHPRGKTLDNKIEIRLLRNTLVESPYKNSAHNFNSSRQGVNFTSVEGDLENKVGGNAPHTCRNNSKGARNLNFKNINLHNFEDLDDYMRTNTEGYGPDLLEAKAGGPLSCRAGSVERFKPRSFLHDNKSVYRYKNKPTAKFNFPHKGERTGSERDFKATANLHNSVEVKSNKELNFLNLKKNQQIKTQKENEELDEFILLENHLKSKSCFFIIY